MQAPPPAPPPARVAYEHDGAVWTIDASGGDAREVLADAYEPAWSPDGSRLAVSQRRRIVTVAADGSDLRVVVRGPVGDPAWSPDGGRIAFTSYRGSVSAIETVGVDGSGRQLILKRREGYSGLTLESPAWSPDGSHLLYTRYTYGRASAVGIVGSDGTGDRRLLRRAVNATYSPDGTRLVFGTQASTEGETCDPDECNPNADVAVADADGSDRRVLLRTRVDEVDPAWSADGTRVTFSSSRNVPHAAAALEIGDGRPFASTEVYSVMADGSCLTWLTNGNRDSSAPRFGPGDATPATCENDRPPTLERPPGRRDGDELWLGEEYHGAMLSARKGSTYTYEDCSSFSPKDCPSPFWFGQSASCDPISRADARYFGRYRRAQRVGDSIALSYPRNPTAYGVAGDRYVGIDAYYELSPQELDRRARFVIGGLRRIDGRPVGPARLPRNLIAKLPRPVRPVVEPC